MRAMLLVASLNWLWLKVRDGFSFRGGCGVGGGFRTRPADRLACPVPRPSDLPSSSALVLVAAFSAASAGTPWSVSRRESTGDASRSTDRVGQAQRNAASPVI